MLFINNTHQLHTKFSSILEVLLLFKCEWKHKLHKKKTNISLPKTEMKSKTKWFLFFYFSLKSYTNTPFLWLQKTVVIISIDRFRNMPTKHNDSHIYFLCIGCNPQHCRSIFYAWVTARKQSLLVLSMHSTQRRENCSEWIETKKQGSGWVLNIILKSRSWEQTIVWIEATDITMYLLICSCDPGKNCNANLKRCVLTWYILLLFYLEGRCVTRDLCNGYPVFSAQLVNCFTLAFWLWNETSQMNCLFVKKLGFDSDTCNHIKSALLSTCSVPIQVCQFGKFQKPVDFSISNVFPPKTATYLSSKTWKW